MIKLAHRFHRALGVLLVFALSAANAFAHATPMLYVPDASSVQEKIPERVRIQFSEHIEPKASSITIYAPDGSRADLKDSRLDTADPRVLTVGVRDAGEGTYTVSWQVVSQDDGHFTKGGFSFGVGEEAVPVSSTADAVQVEHSSTFSQAGAIGIELLGQSMFLAALIAIALLWPVLPTRKITANHQAAFQRACLALVGMGTALVAVGVLTFLILKTLDLEGSRATGFAATLQTFMGTVDGRYAVYRAILGLAFGGYFYGARKKIFARRGITAHEIVLFILVAIMLLDRARVSHAAASHFHPDFSIFVNAVHLFAKEFWVGGLIALALILMPILSRIGRASWLAQVLTSMSKYTSVALAVTAVTGAYIVWLHLKSPAFILTTPWGIRFVVLSVFAGVLSFLRLYNQLYAEKHAVRGCSEPLKGYRREAVRWLQYSIPFEMCVGIALLFVTSYLIITTPPYPAERFTMEKHGSSQGAKISLTVHPVEEKEFLVTVTDEKTGSAIPVTDMIVTLENTEKNIGPLVAETDERFPGGFTFPRNSLSVPGQWKMDITARRTGSYDAAVSIPLNYPADIDSSRIGPDERVPGPFEAILAFVAVSATVVSFFLYRFSARQASRCANLEESRGSSSAPYNLPKSLLPVIPATLAVCAVIWIGDAIFLKGEFQRLCENNGGTWTQSVPMRAGMPLAPEAVATCAVPANDYRFADLREYAFSLQKSPTPAEHHHHP